MQKKLAVTYASSLGRLCLSPVCIRITVSIGYWHFNMRRLLVCYPFVPVWCFSQDRKGHLPGTRGYVIYSQTPEAEGQSNNMLIFHL